MAPACRSRALQLGARGRWPQRLCPAQHRGADPGRREGDSMKVVILAGGYGTRISEESAVRPKPLGEIGGQPKLWHIMKSYSAYGLNDFIVLCGYKGHLIKQYFRDYALSCSDITFDLHKKKAPSRRGGAEPWPVTLLDTGEKTMTGGRIKRARSHLGDEPFCLTYGDGVSDINVTNLIAF